MNQNEYMNKLNQLLKELPKEEKERVSQYYNEIILDKIESGEPEEKVIAELGNIQEIADKIIKDYQPNEEKNSNNMVLKVILIFFASPFILTAFVLYLSLWLIVVSLILAAFCMCLAGILYLFPSVYWLFTEPALGVIQIGTCFTCLGLGILLAMGMKYCWKGMIIFSKRLGEASKNFMIGGKKA